MTSQSEDILVQIAKIMAEQELNMIEACAQFCTAHDIEETVFIKMLDSSAIEQLKYSAVKNRQVRKIVAVSKPELAFE